MQTSLSLFEQTQVRKVWHNDERYFSVVDVVNALVQSQTKDPSSYRRTLKKRLNDEGSQVVSFCHELKLMASDGKYYKTDCSNIEGLFRIIQSIPSPKAEPFKLWLAKVGYERVQEINDPELALNRSREYWQKHGRSEKRIQQRMTGQETRNKLTDYRTDHEVKKGDEFALLTNIIHEERTGLSVRGHKDLKGLKTQNLRDHMSEAELIFTALAELSTRHIAESVQAVGLEENKVASKKGGSVAKNARKELEDKTGKSVVTNENFLKSKDGKQILDS